MWTRYVMRSLRRRLAEEGGFSLVEALAAITILAVGSFAAAQALTFGLSTSGLSRQKLAARSAGDQQMETARGLNYDNLVLSDTTVPHATDPDDPDYWVDETDQTFDPDGSGPLTAEALVLSPGASPSLQHYQNPVLQGNTTYSVYRYVTWVDSPTDGTGGSDASDGNNDGISDASGQDQKRVTVSITWSDQLGRGLSVIQQSSLFSDGKISYHQPTLNNPPSVSCPTVTDLTGKTATFAAVVSDSDGSISSVSWDFGDGTTGTGTTVTHTYASYATYALVNNVVDDGGGSASNSSLNCTVTITDPAAGNGGPDGTVTIASGATYTNTLIVTLSLAKSGGGPNPDKMQFSNDGITWSAKQPFSSSTSWTLVSGDGTKTVYARFYDSAGKYGNRASDTIILDTTPPGAPTNLSATSTIQGANKNVTLTWTAPAGVTDLGGYRVWRRLITSTTWTQVTCGGGTTCTDTHKKTDSYEYYVEAYDLAGSTSAQSNHITS